ncbi:class I SAM-dependent rRNA methyltransferase [Hoeflea sp. WL0058]|uniref:Class I SAM-dependent rRNA methyltransferase n=1 Tax=Flavimaribacter sediminis TaxID=2865987 RepID=A0AAE3D1K9_9HYPH|nr:class I SAM-dependent rRNA methyltransferase [Flavimaribacter sediminis]MBW8637971.1 class I SAM-dependent rRNA methyltransferase [Flavimaribacter sediminis]
MRNRPVDLKASPRKQAGKRRGRPSETHSKKKPHNSSGTRGPTRAEQSVRKDRKPIARRAGDRPSERAPLILETPAHEGYALLDTGDGEKMERYGPFRIVRPEAQALWPRSQPPAEWETADAVFTGDTDEDGVGRWHFPGKPTGESWPMRLAGVDFLARLTSFRHVGVFPEQTAHWQWMRERIEESRRPVKVLNLFGYTGVASLVAADACAEVTHVDASKKAIGWARENQALAGLADRPVRWICDDATKFINREIRRGNRYDVILTDPPKFGRGPDGEVWQLFDDLPHMLDACRTLLSADPIGLVLTAYSIRASFYSIHELMRETMRGAGGCVESGELIIREEARDIKLSTSLFSRWVPA